MLFIRPQKMSMKVYARKSKPLSALNDPKGTPSNRVKDYWEWMKKLSMLQKNYYATIYGYHL